jgi:hypothetical protein
MRVVIEQKAQQDVAYELLRPLSDALETQRFCDACCIGAFGETSVYVRCAEARHGVLVNLASLDENGVARVIRMLEASVEQ